MLRSTYYSQNYVSIIYQGLITGCSDHASVFLLTAVDCDPLNNPSNHHVDHTAGTAPGQTATYSCNTGYDLLGDSTRTCQATGTWSGTAPTCQCM